jgi:hypothetical protein
MPVPTAEKLIRSLLSGRSLKTRAGRQEVHCSELQKLALTRSQMEPCAFFADTKFVFPFQHME